MRCHPSQESRAQPIAAEEAEVDVVYEDEDVLVVNKPPFMRHHPSHRFQGGSLLNVCKGYLGFEPYVVHRFVPPHLLERLWSPEEGE